MDARRSEVREVVVAAWERVLHREDIQPGDDFFDLGGDQFAAAQVLALLEDAFEVTLPLTAFLHASTVAGLSSAVEATQTSAQERHPSIAPVAFSQEGMLWQEQFSPGCQNLPPLVRRYRGRLEVDVLERALAEIVSRHEPLRTTFELRGGSMVQVVAAPGKRCLPVRDLSGLSSQDQEAELDRALADAARPFDLARGPLFEPTLFTLGAEDHVLVMRVHHSVYDDWSVRVFRRELSALYESLRTGTASPLPELALSFTQFARGQRRRLAGRTGTTQLSYWERHLAAAPLILDLPIGDPDRARGAPQASAQPVSVDLPTTLVAQLRALSRRERATPFMTMLTAFQVLLHGCTGQADLLLASVVANRNRTELEGMIGCFTKKVLLRLTASGDPSFGGLLARAREVVLGAMSHQDLPFETVLQEVLGPAGARHGLVPHVAVMFQGVTPQTEEVVLPGVATSGFDTSATTARAHFAASTGEPGTDGDAIPWGAGLYAGTFLIVSVVEAGDGVSLAARGAFHPPAVERLLAAFSELLADIVAHPDRRVSELTASGADDSRDELLSLRGFRVDRFKLEAALRSCPGVHDVSVSVQEDRPGDPRLVAHVVPEGREPPTLARLRAHLWSVLPGYAWPASMVLTREVPGGRGDPLGAGEVQSGQTEEGGRLATLWAEVLGVDQVDGSANYWQSFSFLEVLARARAEGIPLRDEQVMRNRTVAALATDVAAERLSSGTA